MNLLPVIYASLLIFGSLFVIVLVTSYITYKVKQINGKTALATPNSRTVSGKSQIMQRKNLKITGTQSSDDKYKDMQNHNTNSKLRPQNNIVAKHIEHKVAKDNQLQSEPSSSKKSPRFVRMTRVQDIRLNGSTSSPRSENYFRPAMEAAKVSNGSILRYYEDF